MKNNLVRKSSLFLFALLFSSVTFAQQYVTTGDFDRFSKASIGFGLNTYLGELRRVNDPSLQTGLSMSLGYEHLFTDNIALRASLSIYSIKADDALSPIPANKVRNINFKATNVEFVAQALYYMFRHPASGYKDRSFANPYIHLGFGVTSNNPNTTLAGTDYKLRPLSLEGVQYGGLAVVVPFGAGVSIFVSRYVDLQIEFQYKMYRL